jgi:type II secretory pathway component PulF
VTIVPKSLVARLCRVLTRTVPFDQLSVFVGNLATCLEAGLGIPESMETSTRSSPSLFLRELGQAAAERVRCGQALSESLAPAGPRFPAFFLPVIQCGERSGRLGEALRYLQDHCRLLDRPTRVMRSTYLVPLGIFIGSSAICVAAHFMFAPLGHSLIYLVKTIADYVLLALVVMFVLAVPQAKRLWDRLRLALPTIGSAERDISINRFFHALHLLYATGGIRVEEMIRLAAATVDNLAVRADLLRATATIESGGTVAEAFAELDRLTQHERGSIATGDMSGKLEEVFAMLCRQAGESAEHHLRLFQAMFFRVVVAVATLAIVTTIMSLTSFSQ